MTNSPENNPFKKPLDQFEETSFIFLCISATASIFYFMKLRYIFVGGGEPKGVFLFVSVFFFFSLFLFTDHV